MSSSDGCRVPALSVAAVVDAYISRTEAEAMIVQARLAAGWITEDDLAREAEALAAEGAEEDETVA